MGGFLFTGYRAYDQKNRDEQHSDYYIVGILPMVFVGKPCRHHIAGLGNEQDEEIKYGHEERAFPLQSILHIGGRLFFHREHGKRVHARQIGSDGKRAVQHDDDAHEARQQTGGKQYRDGGRDGANVGAVSAAGSTKDRSA